MPEILQNVLYLTTPGLFVSRDHLTFVIERERSRVLSLPAHHVESICIFSEEIVLTHGAMGLALEEGIPINYLSENGHLRARVVGVPETSVSLRRAQFRAAEEPAKALQVARCCIAGKFHNARNSLLRGSRETGNPTAESALERAADELARLIRALPEADNLDSLRGLEGLGAKAYFAVLACLLKKQHEEFLFPGRSRQPPLDRMNCLLSFIYALVRHDCIAALTSAGLDPFVGFLHAERPNRPALALDLMEEFRPWLADRLALTLVNRQQIQPNHFRVREGGAVELTEDGRRSVIKAYQERKREGLTHPLLQQQVAISRHFFVQARILARFLRGDIEEYLPLIPR